MEKKPEHKSTFSIEVALDNATNVSPCSFSESPYSIDKISRFLKNLRGDSEKEHGLTFVALSRATDINNVFLGAGCSFERITTKISSGFKLKQRLVEDIRLQSLYENTLAFYELN